MSDSKDSDSPHAQRLHDLHAVHSNFKSVLHLLKSGYQFNDKEAISAFAQLEKSVACLAKEIRILEKEWRESRDSGS